MDFRGPLEKAQYLKDACSCSGHMAMKGAKSITMRRMQSISAHLIYLNLIYDHTVVIQLVYTIILYQQLMLPKPPLPVLLYFWTGPTIVHRHGSGARVGKLCTKMYVVYLLVTCYIYMPAISFKI